MNNAESNIKRMNTNISSEVGLSAEVEQKVEEVSKDVKQDLAEFFEAAEQGADAVATIDATTGIRFNPHLNFDENLRLNGIEPEEFNSAFEEMQMNAQEGGYRKAQRGGGIGTVVAGVCLVAAGIAVVTALPAVAATASVAAAAECSGLMVAAGSYFTGSVCVAQGAQTAAILGALAAQAPAIGGGLALAGVGLVTKDLKKGANQDTQELVDSIADVANAAVVGLSDAAQKAGKNRVSAAERQRNAGQARVHRALNFVGEQATNILSPAANAAKNRATSAALGFVSPSKKKGKKGGRRSTRRSPRRSW